MNAAIACPWCLKVVKKSSYKRHKAAKKCLSTGTLLKNKRSSCRKCARPKNNLQALQSILLCDRCGVALELIKDFDKQYRDFKSLKDWVNWLSSPVLVLPKKNTSGELKGMKKPNASITDSVHQNYIFNQSRLEPNETASRDELSRSTHDPTSQLNQPNYPRSINRFERCPTTNDDSRHHGRDARGWSRGQSSHANYYNHMGYRRSFNNSMPIAHFNNDMQSPAEEPIDRFVDRPRSQAYFNNRREDYHRTSNANQYPFTSNENDESYLGRSLGPHLYQDCQPRKWPCDELPPLDHSRSPTNFSPNRGNCGRSFSNRAGPPSRESFVHHLQPDDLERSPQARFNNRNPNHSMRDLREVIHENRRLRGGYSRPSMTGVQEYHSSSYERRLTTANEVHISITNYNRYFGNH